MDREAIHNMLPDFAYEQALLLHDDDPQKSDTLLCAAHLFKSRYAQSPNKLDLDKLVSALALAITVPHQHLIQAEQLAKLDLFSLRNEGLPALSDIDRAIFAVESSITITPAGQGNKPACLNNLGNSFLWLFERKGVLGDVDKAITAYDAAVQLTPESDARRPGYLRGLGNALLSRFKCKGELDDSNKSISALDDAARLTADDKPTYLDDLGSSLLFRFEFDRDLSHITRAVSAYEAAVQLTPLGSHAAKVRRLTNLATSFTQRFGLTNELEDVKEAISANNTALQLVSEDHVAASVCLNSLGLSFLCSFEYTGDLDDVNKAISALETAVQLTSEDHADMPVRLINLGNSYFERFEYSGDRSDIHMAVSQFRLSASSSAGRPRIRFCAALIWAHLAIADHTLVSLDGCDATFNRYPRVTWLRQSIFSRHNQSIFIGGIEAVAASAAAESGRHETVLEWLERECSVIQVQLHQSCIPDGKPGSLGDGDRELAGDLVRTSKALESASIRAENDRVMSLGHIHKAIKDLGWIAEARSPRSPRMSVN